ncbi:cupin [Caldimicrobium thiodismutans]|uniref:Cupin n=1 Tax=Caldimicrobium thiodismutans TaxID=1653476 RepID=A0A0U5AUW6_9BACT|nr:cupin domain-containing protein [Caldimicrobium thiodismutans]BAU23032.1 cupin [Caldimicrobium thiodismutans]
MILNLKDLQMEKHPKFKGVKIGFLVTKEKHPELSITVLEIDPGIEIPIHQHEKEVDSIFLLEGEGEVYLEDKWQKIKSGDVIVVSPGIRHGVKNTGSTKMRCYIVHAPALW